MPASAGIPPFAPRQHAELPSNLVFARRCPIRIQHVSFVEDGVSNFAGALNAHGCASRESSRRVSITSSQVASARRDLNFIRSESVSRFSRGHPLFGK